MERTIEQIQQVGSSVLDATQRVLEVVGNALKPGIDAALPIAQQASEQALRVASPAISEASKKAQEAIQSTGIDTEPVLSAAKVFPNHQLHIFSELFITCCLCAPGVSLICTTFI